MKLYRENALDSEKITQYKNLAKLRGDTITTTTKDSKGKQAEFIEKYFGATDPDIQQKLYLQEDNYEIVQVIGENLEYSDKESEENENSGSSVGSKEYEIIENDNN